MSDGILLIDKPAGPTSHDVVGDVRRALQVSRVGHAGTLDPPATGLLVVMVGRATRLARFISLLRKRYEAVIHFGVETTTGDAAGLPEGEGDDSWRRLAARDVERGLEEVKARPEQVPPNVSAKKVGGERAYRLARRGEVTELKAAPVTIFELRLSSYDSSSGAAGVTVECSSGTYVRSIARDLGRALGSRAHLASLRRTQIGPWTVGDAVTLPLSRSPTLPTGLRPMREAVAHLPAVIVPEADAARFAHGQKIPAAAADGPVAVFGADQLIGVADCQDGVLHPDVVLIG